MKRIKVTPRVGFKEKIEGQGIIFHTIDNKAYWHEEAYYQFTMAQITRLEMATAEIWDMLLRAVDFVITNKRYEKFHIPPEMIPLIEQTWEEEPPSVYARIDIAWDGKGEIKLLEANADTPTMLLESSVIQWFWKEDVLPTADQFNSIHEKLVQKWRSMRNEMCFYPNNIVHFAHLSVGEERETNVEDAMTCAYMMDTALQGGLNVIGIDVGNLGEHESGKLGDTQSDQPIDSLFKLYPWEWIVNEEPALVLSSHAAKTQWIEPIWKMLLSNKAILVILWELFPANKYLLEAHFDSPHGMSEYVKKPLLSREGANVTIIRDGETIASSGGDYGEEGYVFQEFYAIPEFEGHYPMIGSWIIDGQPAGIGIRDGGIITDNLSKFTPHAIED